MRLRRLPLQGATPADRQSRIRGVRLGMRRWSGAGLRDASPALSAQRAAMTPRLTIVVPALNEAARIEACLDALAPLRRRGVEVIVVDGGSSDGTAALAEPLADRVLNAP